MSEREVCRHGGWSIWHTAQGWEARLDGKMWMQFGEDTEAALDAWWVISGVTLDDQFEAARSG
jgi:hypothetical protein